MAKFLKSLFSSEKKRVAESEIVNENEFTPPIDSRRKLSISRSGRMKQNKKRASITHDFFGEEYQAPEWKYSKEYHMHGRVFSEAASPGRPYKTEQPRTQIEEQIPKTEELSAHTEELSVDTDESIVNAEGLSAKTRQLSTNTEELSVNTEELSAKTEELTTDDQVSDNSLNLEREVEMAFKIIYNT